MGTDESNKSERLGGTRKTAPVAELTPTVALTTPLPIQPANIIMQSDPAAGLEALASRYEILGELGRGGMGLVYKARDRETGETVALKILKPEIASDQAMMERFKNELLLARKITHKHVCRVFELNRAAGFVYTSMEYVEGESLRSILRRLGQLPVRKGTEIATQICAGLREAHEQHIVHRDLKPENVMLDAAGNIKLMDFGISRSLEATTKLTGNIVGTPAYMAPEQVAGKPVDYRTDIYSLGLILYEMFTGRPTFEAENAVTVALKQLNQRPQPPHEIEPAIPGWLERIILKCIEKEPGRRFQSAAELETALRGQTAPLVTPLPSPGAVAPFSGMPSRSFSRDETPAPKKRVPILAWALLLLALVAAGAVARRWQDQQSALPATSVKTAASSPSLSAPPPSAAAPSQSDDSSKPSAQDVAQASAENTAQNPAQDATRSPADHPKPSKRTPSVAATENSAETASSDSDSPPMATSASDMPNGFPASATSSRHTDSLAGQSTAAPSVPASSSVANSGTAATYLWVGRFAREEKAQELSQQVMNAGVPVLVVPKRGMRGEFFVVFAGPFRGQQWVLVQQKLEEAGLKNVHPVSNPYARPQGTAQDDPVTGGEMGRGRRNQSPQP